MSIYKNIDAWDTREWSRTIKSSKTLQDSEIRLNKRAEDGGAVLHDVYFGLYKADPQVKEDEEILSDQRWIKDTMSALKDTSEWKELRNRCRLNPVDAEVATCELIKTLEPLVPDLAPKKGESQDPHPASQLLNMLASDGPGGGGQATTDEASNKLRRTMRKAAKKAIEEMDAIEDAMQGMGYGSGDGVDGMTSSANKLKLSQMLRDNDRLKRIAELAGKFRRIASQTQKSKPRRGMEEIHDVTLGDDLARLVPAEMLNLAQPLRKLDMLRRMTEKQLVQYALRGRQREAKGPIVFCIDNSSSMRGDRDTWAKACMLAIANIARAQKRTLVVIHFNSTVQRIDTFEAGKYDFTDLVECALFFSGGGTDFEPALGAAAFEVRGRHKNADIIFITDDDCDIESAFVEDFNKFKTENDTQVIGIPVFGAGERVLNKFCDQIEPVYNMTDSGKAMTTMFSV